ncbi:MAG: DUF6326 family protein [Candidatus Hodarchaeales archaeon]|jgi:hypothetical protein
MTNEIEDVKVNVKIKLSALWASLVLIYLYADLFAFYVTGHLEEAIAGEMAGMQITQVLLLGFMIFMTIPSLMVFLSLILKAKVNRWTNIIVAILQIGLVLPSVIGDSNLYFIFASIVETVLLVLIIYFAWTWPIKEGVKIH